MSTAALTKTFATLGASLGFAVLSMGSALAYNTSLSNTGTNRYSQADLQIGAYTKGNQTMGASLINDSTAGKQFWVYCVDPLTTSKLTSTYATATLDSFMGVTLNSGGVATGGNGAASAYKTLFTSAPYSTVDNYEYQSGTVSLYNNLVELYSYAYKDSMTSNTKSAAFQYVLWELLGDAGSGVADPTKSGGAYFSNTNFESVRTQAEKYLDALNNANESFWTSSLGLTKSAYNYTVYKSTSSPSSQAFLAVSDKPSKVPEPGSIALAFAAFGAVAYTRRRKQ
ncbi:PEP-CTERM sorting domain-containing protein [Mitsuaria sp. WAJ17]|uniref:PEP-CTERM sorting domain-containing protein n=1 Tax=Mitsuaria sp. WAJ17 TaxID=2761452 RepID=UPI001601EE55|nr:PEP-CTERM sorting domain-containing protein [Mitsuaria sp. WAJ17]MBB2486865.1 PEP-CTERM sorting domain-containing protein [Mitsuaria sp. WAJ17]